MQKVMLSSEESASIQDLGHLQDLSIRDLIETLRAEHRELESRLDELDAQVWLTPEEQVERKNCQKLKLAKKDRIYELSKLLS